MKANYFFCGIGGSGMNPLARILLHQGASVRGSDRSHDRGETPDKFSALNKAGIGLFPQDGSGLDEETDVLVVSSAVEDSIPDVKRALDLGIKIEKRAEILAGIFNGMRGVGIAGTSGKTTVTGMVTHMLYELGQDPTAMVGGQMINFLEAGLSGNAPCGDSDLFVAEVDESDGSIALYNPAIAVVNNIRFDHKPIEELRPLFRDYIERAKDAAIINLDDPEAAALVSVNPKTITFSRDNSAADITAADLPVELSVPGAHNISNALAALCVAKALGLDLKKAAQALASFKGIKRRFEIVGVENDITVIDDFGHNPDKIEATLKTVNMCGNRVIAIFQPHGFGPTRMLKDGFIDVFAEQLKEGDILLMPEIYFAGGTANKNISSADIIEAVKEKGRTAHFMESRDAIRDFIAANAKAGDRILVMGARDDTLSEFAGSILNVLKQKAA